MKYLPKILRFLAILLSNVMCAVVAYTYCDLSWRADVQYDSVSTDVAFVLAIPCIIGIVACLVIAHFLDSKRGS